MLSQPYYGVIAELGAALALGVAIIALAPILSPMILLLFGATFIALLVAGQMLASITFDHFGWLGLAQRSIDLPRLAGAALLIAGVVLIRR